MTQTELTIAIEVGLKNLCELSPQLCNYYIEIVYDQLDQLVLEQCTESLLKQIETDVMQLTIN